VFGGMKGITYTQIAQYVIMIFAYTVPAVFIAIQLTGHPLPQLGLGSTLAGTDTYLLKALDQTLMDLGFAAYTSVAGMTMLNMFLLTLALMIGTAGLPHVIIRFFTVPRVRDARKSAGWALVFIGILYTTAPAVGAMAMYNFINTVQPGPVGDPAGQRDHRGTSRLDAALGADRPAAVGRQERRRPLAVLQPAQRRVRRDGAGGIWLGRQRVHPDRP
jgi:cation/acetate symporter